MNDDTAAPELPDAAPSVDSATGTEPGFTEPKADRPPTEEEEAVADRVAEDVDLGSVGDHYREATETGAQVQGEGQIEP